MEPMVLGSIPATKPVFFPSFFFRFWFIHSFFTAIYSTKLKQQPHALTDCLCPTVLWSCTTTWRARGLGLTVICETKWSETKWKSVVCEMKICSLRNENPLENADFKFSVNNGRNNGAEGTSLSTAKATPTTRDRGTGDWNQRHYDRFTLSKTQIS